MSFRWRRIMTTLGFIGSLAVISPACMLQARARVKPAYVVDEPPPPPQYRTDVRARAGYVWVRGNWEWRGGRWVWDDGHWVRARSNQQWEHGHWERRGNRWHWVEGRWSRGGVAKRPSRHLHEDDSRARPAPGRSRPAPDRSRPAPGRSRPAPGGPVVRDHRYPSEAPPSPRSESPGQRNGYVWIDGHWDWQGGDWKWKPGHWERARAGYHWQSGRWESQGNHYRWVDGTWVKGKAQGGVKVRDHRTNSNTEQQPARRNRSVPVRRGDN